jgi:2,3-bisphosphoglycerate-dependent phosphoglycerate mutase
MGRLILIRHCASGGQHADAELTEAGAAAAEVLAERLARLAPDALYASPYRRAMATLEPFAARAGLPIVQEPRLKERVLAGRDLPDWLDHIRRSFDEPDLCAPGGESLNQVQSRALAALATISALGHGLALAASHGNLIASVLRAADPGFGFEGWRSLGNPDLFDLDFEGDRLRRWRRLT